MKRLLIAFSCATAVVTLGPSASAAPAESTKILPQMEFATGAVDSAGGSLVAGVVAQLIPATDGLYVYHRDPRGRWSGRTAIPLSDPGDAPEINDLAVAAGTDGFYVIAWVQLEGNEGTDGAAVHVTTRLPSGKITEPKELFATENLTPLHLSTNANGDAALTQAEPTAAARYVRTVGWTTFDVPDESGEEQAPGDGGGHKGNGAAMMSPARTVDITYEYRIDGFVHVIQQSRSHGATSFTRRDLYTAPDASSAGFTIAMDSAGLQTLAIDDSDDAIKVYRENTRRGPFEFRWRKARGDASRRTPLIDSGGRFTRVTWTASGTSTGQTRLFNGTAWGPSQATADDGYYSMEIGNDGRGAAAGRAGGEYVLVWLERNSSINADRDTVGLIQPPLVRVGADSVSQTVSVERGSENTAARTVVYIRR